MAETTFTFRVDEELKTRFVEAAKSSAQSPSVLLRHFMEDYLLRADHDPWFRAKVEEGLVEAAKPEAVLVPHDEAIAGAKSRIAAKK